MNALASLAPLCGTVPLGVERVPKVGVYLLVERADIVYVGQSTDIELRIAMHCSDVRTGKAYAKRFDRALWFVVPRDLLTAYEGALIRRLHPRHNFNAPTHDGGDNEILVKLGLDPHEDENAAAEAWLRVTFKRSGRNPRNERIIRWRSERRAVRKQAA